MIKEYLEKHYNIGRLYNSYLINTDRIDSAILEVEDFISSKILTNGDLDRNVDYFCVKKEDSVTKNISIDQIRKLQNFLYKSSVISGKKIAVIYGADQMNLNSANSCLKILEDTPADTHIFLLTENAASILPTIRSRCAKITHHYSSQEQSHIDDKFIKPLLKSSSVAEHLDFIKIFAKKDRDLWIEFSSAAEKILTKFCRYLIGMRVDLSETENKLLEQFDSNSPQYFQIKYDKVREIIDNTNKFDLDLRNASVLLIKEFRDCS